MVALALRGDKPGRPLPSVMMQSNDDTSGEEVRQQRTLQHENRLGKNGTANTTPKSEISTLVHPRSG